jgi:hypothetical protein
VPHATLSLMLHAWTVPVCSTVCVSHLIVVGKPLVLLLLALVVLDELVELDEVLEPPEEELASVPGEPSVPPSPELVADVPEHATATSAEAAIKAIPWRFVRRASIDSD